MAERDAAPAPAKHIPVMLAEVMAALTMPASKAAAKALKAPLPAAGAAALPLAGQRIVDGTFGNGGYSRAFLAAGADVLGLDRDPDAVAAAQKLAAQSGGRFHFCETEFSRLDEAAAEIWGRGETAAVSEKQEAARSEAPSGNEKCQEVAKGEALRGSEKCPAGEGLPAAGAVPSRRPEASASLAVSEKTQAEQALLDAVVLDIGVSSMQIDEAERGFSFQKDGPLDMRMAQSGMSAADAVNRLKPEDLARIFHFYGEERRAGRIARMIAARRESRPFTSTLDLAAAIAAMGLHKREKIHAATRSFQALRIYVNDELGELARALAAAERALKPGGRLIVVSFHSLEDRVVKKFFAARAGGRPGSRHLPDAAPAAPSFLPLIKGAQSAGAAEIAANPRARSAKLRAGLRTNAAPCRDDETIYGFADLPPLFEE